MSVTVSKVSKSPELIVTGFILNSLIGRAYTKSRDV
ncbi:hypothetical protein J2S28_005574 [Rhizobium sp. SLBN-94]|nr:hypothetical protein [Rhizobium sp. SLBN-94]